MGWLWRPYVGEILEQTARVSRFAPYSTNLYGMSVSNVTLACCQFVGTSILETVLFHTTIYDVEFCADVDRDGFDMSAEHQSDCDTY